ncbi:heterokaryon incompatibility protein-domain-containing protein, partial [Phyllosticta capitalensis]
MSWDLADKSLYVRWAEADIWTSTQLERHTGLPSNESLILYGEIPEIQANFATGPHGHIEVFTLPGAPTPWPEVGSSRFLQRKTSSRESFNQVKSWLTDCFQSHDRCNSPKHGSLLPKRLIDVLGDSVKLVETHDKESRYLCLSHCWGDSTKHPRPLETTKNNFCGHKNGIHWAALPKTFQDAILSVRFLGESYIWIDSLCIIQDCREDWYQESAKMASIYQNSLLTLAATTSTNSSEGLLSIPDKEYEPLPFHVKYLDGVPFTIYCRKALSHWFGPERSETPPLLTRAWAFQELNLSPRILHFGYQELIWECKELTSCECGIWDNSKSRCPQNMMRLKLDQPVEVQKYVQSTWQLVVSKYSQLELTKASDRLPAIAGIAKQIQVSQEGGEYLSGLWKHSLIHDIEWYIHDISRSTRDTSFAPSWSWACID